jgi:hypothetical protein
MPKSTAFDPVVTRSGTEQYGLCVLAKSYTVAIDPNCRQFLGDQTVIPDAAN